MPRDGAPDLWDRVRERLRDRVAPRSFETWIGPIRCLRLSPDDALLGVPNVFILDWVEEGGFFESPRHTTGARIDYAFTHNVLVRTAALAGMDTLFDERMALTGGSDAEFFRRFARTGHRIVWADEALVFEWVPATRSRLRCIPAAALPSSSKV